MIMPKFLRCQAQNQKEFSQHFKNNVINDKLKGPWVKLV